MNTSGNSQGVVGLAAGMKEVLSSSLNALGHFHEGEYVLSRHCLESVKDLIRSLRRDNESYDIRRYFGQAKVVQNDLLHVIKVCPTESEDLFGFAIRLLTTLTTPVPVLYNEEIPVEKIGRRIYMKLIEDLQEYKEAFYDIDFWNVICGKLTDLFEIDWAERSESQCLQIEKLLVLIRNVLHVPEDPDREKITENDVSVHDKILWSLRQSQILEFLLYVSSNKGEQRYYLHLLEIFSLILREQHPKLLALSELQSSHQEREKEIHDLAALREREKINKNKYKNTRTFESTLVLKGLKNFSGKDVFYHGSLKDVKESFVSNNKKHGKPRRSRRPVQSEQTERKSSFSVRIFLREFCTEFLNCSFNNMMTVVKEKLVAGKGLPNDEIFYFWALDFFLEFNLTCNHDIKLISHSLHTQTFHFLQTHMDENFEKLVSEKKKKNLWVRKLHAILKAYSSLLQTLKWMDSSRDATIRQMSTVLKSQVFYVAEYRDMALTFLTKYDPDLFSLSYLRDLIETTHLSMKLLEEFTKSNKIVVRKKFRKIKRVRKSRPVPVYESNMEKWDRLKEKIRENLMSDCEFPDIAPFDVLSELSDQEQKKVAMKNIQKLLHEERIKDGIGLLRSARRVWPENDHFGKEGMSAEDELEILNEICLAELGNEQVPLEAQENEEDEVNIDDEEEEEVIDDDELGVYGICEESFDMMSYKKQLVNKRIVEACGILLKNYAENSTYTNHCIIKLLFRIGWECRMPAMMYQASLFSTLLNVMKEKYRDVKEIKNFAVHLIRSFQEHALKNKFAFVELLFWKDPGVALEIQNEAENTSESNATNMNRKGRKASSWSVEEEDELQRLWGECSADLPQKKKIEWIKSNMIDESKSLQGVKRKLIELGLIANTRQAAKLNSKKEWVPEEVEELTKLFHQFHSASDIVMIIYDHLTVKRTKQSIRQKLVELGLVSSISQLRKKKKRGVRDEDVSEESELSEESDNETARIYSLEEQNEALKRAQHLKPALEWLRDTIQECLEEDDEETQAYPLLAVEQVQIDALETEVFIDLLKKLGLQEPVLGQVYWKIPKTNKMALTHSVNLLNDAINGDLCVYDSPESEDEFEKLKRFTQERSQARRSSNILENQSENIQSSGDCVDEPANYKPKLVAHELSKSDSDSSDGEMKLKTTKKSRFSRRNRDLDEERNNKRKLSEVEKDSDRVDNNESDEFVSQHSPKDLHKKNRNKRCCIASDSEEEDSGDLNEMSEKVNRRVRVLDSDSDLE